MSTSTSHSATSVPPTRQQLDELEALMQRMLDLPVNHLDERPSNGVADVVEAAEVEPDPTADWREDPLQPSEEWIPSAFDPIAPDESNPSSDQPLAEWPAPLSPPEWPDLAEFAPGMVHAAQRTEHPGDQAWASNLEDLAWNDVPGDSQSKTSVSDMGPDKQTAASTTVPPMPPVEPWLLPLVWFNVAFDGLTFLLGPLGRWLRGPTGRAVMGWIGVLLVAGSMAWALFDWMGWTW